MTLDWVGREDRKLELQTMLPPLHHAADMCIALESSTRGPSRETLLRAAVPAQLPPRPPGCSAPRRVSARKPSSAAYPAPFTSPRRPTERPSLLPQSCDPKPLLPGVPTAIEVLSRIPREFFVVETNAVLPQMQYPPTQYQSTFIGRGSWETVVFPALTPCTRQQVLYLRQTLEQMRVRVSSAAIESITGETLEYTEKEWALHSVCFHELARQIKFICKEQSELLFEIQEAYDTSVARLVALARQLQGRVDQMQGQLIILEDQRRQRGPNAEDSSVVNQDGKCDLCTCQQPEHESSMRPVRRQRADDEDNSDDDEATWRSFQRQRLDRMREFGEGVESGWDDEHLGGRLQRASVVEENTAAVRVQQAFAKYQQRKEAQRALQRQEKKDAALDIQRSYRGYRERKRALHHRAVMYTILKRRKQIAAVELLQLNVRTYLIKKRREGKHSGGDDAEHQSVTAAAAQESMLKAQRAALAPNQLNSDQLRELGSDTQLLGLLANPLSDPCVQLLNGLTELAAVFSLLHSRRRNAKPAQIAVDEEHEDAEIRRGPDTNADPNLDPSPHPFVKGSIESNDAARAPDKVLLEETIRRAEGVITSFQSVISELRGSSNNAEELQCSNLAKATSTTTLCLSAADEPVQSSHESQLVLEDTAPFVLLDDVNTLPAAPHKSLKAPTSLLQFSTSEQRDMDEVGHISNVDENDDTHLDDVLWQASIYTPRTADEIEDEASARDLLVRELLSSHDQQKRLAALKQFIADIYDTIVGRLRELPRERLRKLVCIHASLALSFSDGQRYLRGRNRTCLSESFAVGPEYESIDAFVGSIDLTDLVHDHFHCQLGLKHLVDLAKERMVGDLRHFMGLDPDVQRFHDYLMRERPTEDLVFFSLCRLFARNCKQSRQPAFQSQTMREVIESTSALDVARELFHAAGDDASMVKTDAFVVEPSNEIYTRYLPSAGLQQLEAILGDYMAPVDRGHTSSLAQGKGPSTRSSNINHFHAREYNASAARSPVMRRDRPDQPPCPSDPPAGPETWVYFEEFVDLLRRYRKVMRHFHAFIQWAYDLFHEAFRHQKQQQLVSSATDCTPLLEEAAFVQTLLPYSLGASERDLRNVFHNALKQRHLQRLMPVRVFVSVVLVLLRNGLLSVASYKPLERRQTSPPTEALQHDRASLATHRRRRQEQLWMRLALQWRAQEQRFEATIERLYSAPRDANSVDPASQLLQWRNELFELFMSHTGLEGIERAQRLYELLVGTMARENIEQDLDASTPTTASEEHSVPDAVEVVASAVGSPWTTDEGAP